MYRRNDGSGNTNVLQNQFTAYLTKAIRNVRNRYIRSRARQHERECSMEDKPYSLLIVSESAKTPAMEETEELLAALKSIKDREQYVFLTRVLDEKGFGEIAGELGISYKGVASIYYRTVEKLRKRLEG